MGIKDPEVRRQYQREYYQRNAEKIGDTEEHLLKALKYLRGEL